jgi:hypothetical protein
MLESLTAQTNSNMRIEGRDTRKGGRRKRNSRRRRRRRRRRRGYALSCFYEGLMLGSLVAVEV